MNTLKTTKATSFWDKKAIVSYFLAVLVFWIHCSAFANYSLEETWASYFSIFFQKIITPAGPTLFFIISGAMFFRDYSDKNYLKKIKNRIRTLIIPFLAWNILNMLFEIFATKFFAQYFVSREEFRFSVRNILEGIFHYKYNGPFWFVFSLIFFSLAAPIINKLLYNKWLGIIVILIAAVGTQFNIGLPTPFFYSQSSIVYYLIGAYVGKYYCKIFSDTSVDKTKTIISAGIIIVCCLYNAACIFDSCKSITIINECVFVIESFSIWYIFNYICSKIKKYDFMEHSFWVYALHTNVGAIIAKLIYFVLPKRAEFSVINFVLTTVGTLISIELICRIVRKLCKPLYLCLSGNR